VFINKCSSSRTCIKDVECIRYDGVCPASFVLYPILYLPASSHLSRAYTRQFNLQPNMQYKLAIKRRTLRLFKWPLWLQHITAIHAAVSMADATLSGTFLSSEMVQFGESERKVAVRCRGSELLNW